MPLMTRRSSVRRAPGWIPTRSATPSTALVPQRKVGFPIPNAGLLLGFQGTKTARREGISSPFSDAGGCTSPQNSGAPTSSTHGRRRIAIVSAERAPCFRGVPVALGSPATGPVHPAAISGTIFADVLGYYRWYYR